MQFKYPELLWALFLLLIPILIHLFQLRRFKKTPFTNVRFLKKVVSESRRSNTLKKWLLLLTRLLLLAALVISFAQPFFANKSALKKKETVIYLDNSFSMQLKNNGTTLLENAVQELIRSIPDTDRFSIFTNDRIFKEVDLKDVQNELLALSFVDKQLNLNEIQLKGETFFTNDNDTQKNLVVVSDFQQLMEGPRPDSTKTANTYFIQLSVNAPQNVSIDTASIKTEDSGNLKLTVLLSSNVNREDLAVSVYNGEQLMAKSAANFKNSKKAEVNFTLTKDEAIAGKVQITDIGLNYDNQLFFNIDEKDKINVLAVGPSDSDYLNRIFSEDEFSFSSSSLKNLDYSIISTQNLIVLDGLPSLPNSLTTNLKAFVENGGHLTVVPSSDSDVGSYNQLLSNYFSTRFTEKINEQRNITNISFSHPLYSNVFEKNVTNFQYPKVFGYYGVKTNAPTALTFENNDAFLIGSDKVFSFTASLSSANSNFRSSPLIVPTFYNMGTNSLKLPKLYHTIGNQSAIDIPISLTKDNVLTIARAGFELIPLQQSLNNRVSITLDENLEEAGVYVVQENGKPIKNISFNFTRNESDLTYLPLDQLPSVSTPDSITALFETLEKENRLTELWKWFVILALLFAMVEVLIQKFLK